MNEFVNTCFWPTGVYFFKFESVLYAMQNIVNDEFIAIYVSSLKILSIVISRKKIYRNAL